MWVCLKLVLETISVGKMLPELIGHTCHGLHPGCFSVPNMKLVNKRERVISAGEILTPLVLVLIFSSEYCKKNLKQV